MSSFKIAALVPMRHHSQRVPGKNFRPMVGKPLYAYILETLLAVKEIDEIWVDTDSPVILDGVTRAFPTINCLERPHALRGDLIPMNEILMHVTERVNADFYLQTHSTNPLLLSQTISNAIRQFTEAYPAYDSCFGVTRRQVRFWDQLTRPINHNPAILLQTQDLPPVFEENSCLYLFSRKTLAEKRNRLGDRPMMFEIAPDEAWDVDTEMDFSITEMMLQNRLRPK